LICIPSFSPSAFTIRISCGRNNATVSYRQLSALLSIKISIQLAVSE
jgi:hypothetical protein